MASLLPLYPGGFGNNAKCPAKRLRFKDRRHCPIKILNYKHQSLYKCKTFRFLCFLHITKSTNHTICLNSPVAGRVRWYHQKGIWFVLFLFAVKQKIIRKFLKAGALLIAGGKHITFLQGCDMSPDSPITDTTNDYRFKENT